MIRNINRDIISLSRKSIEADINDISIGKDLIDTLNYNKDKCIGMAANMIGINKRVIVVSTGMFNIVMYNPVIIKKCDMYETEEGCLSLDGLRKCIRYNIIEVEYYDDKFNKKIGKYSGLISEIIQHEIDHLDGIII